MEDENRLGKMLVRLAREGYDISFIGNHGIELGDGKAIVVTVRKWVPQEENFLLTQAVVEPQLIDDSYMTNAEILAESIYRLREALDVEIEELNNG